MQTLLQYSSIADATVGNSASGSILPSANTDYVGSISTFNNLFLDNIGSTLRIIAKGFYSTKVAATGTLRIFFSFNGSAIIDTGTFTPPASIVGGGWDLDCLLTVRTIGMTGSIIGQGLFKHFSTASDFAQEQMVNTGTSVIDTTILQMPDIQVEWSTPDVDNTISSTNIFISIIA